MVDSNVAACYIGFGAADTVAGRLNFHSARKEVMSMWITYTWHILKRWTLTIQLRRRTRHSGK